MFSRGEIRVFCSFQAARISGQKNCEIDLPIINKKFLSYSMKEWLR